MNINGVINKLVSPFKKTQGANNLKLKHKFDRFLLKNPLISTIFTASILATIWLFVWLIVLFLITFSTGSGTTAEVFLAGLILSTASEAIIRRAEISSKFERWGRGTLHEDEIEISFSWSLSIALGGVLLVILLNDILAVPEKVNWELKRSSPNQSLPEMFSCWIDLFRNSSLMTWSVVWCWVMRVIIYKRPSQTKTWEDVKKHMAYLEKSSGSLFGD